jgi:hypothetical protein
MAQTKTSRKKAKPKTRTSVNGKAKRPSAVRKPRARPSSSSKRTPSKPQAVLDTVEETAKNAGGSMGRVAKKAKVPLVAGGAALAAGAGGLALGAHQAHRKNGLGGVSGKDLAKAARKAGDVGAQIGEVALEVRRARESSNGHGRAHRSPIEVVLQGLTSRG